jgi:hypothetical protein
MNIKIVGCKMRYVCVFCVYGQFHESCYVRQKCFLGISLEQKGMLLSNFKYISKILLVISNPNCYKFAQTLQKLCSISYLAYVTYLWTYPGGKNFENAPKFKSSPQNNGISAAFLKQMSCGTSVYSKYLLKYNIKN